MNDTENHRHRMIRIVHRLLEQHSPKELAAFREHMSTWKADQNFNMPSAPAMNCVIRFRSGYQMEGVLSFVRDPNHPNDIDYAESLRMAMNALIPNPDHPRNPNLAKKVIIEHFFDYDDLECVMMVHEPTSNEKSPLIISG